MPLADVWVFDTYTSRWHELSPSLKLQGSLAGKKIKKFFEPRLAHTACVIGTFVVVFGGLNSSKKSLITNDIYVLCLDKEVARILPDN